MARSPTVCRFVSLYYISSLFCYASSLFLSSPTLYFSIKSLLFSPSFSTFVFNTRLFWIFSPFLEVCPPALVSRFLHIFPSFLVIQPPPLLYYFPLSHLLSLEYVISLYLSAFPFSHCSSFFPHLLSNVPFLPFLPLCFAVMSFLLSPHLTPSFPVSSLLSASLFCDSWWQQICKTKLNKQKKNRKNKANVVDSTSDFYSLCLPEDISLHKFLNHLFSL